MHVAIVVPGIMGTRLVLPGASGVQDEEVWPPTVLETQFGYGRRDKLASAKVVPGAIIESVACFDFYKPLFGLMTDVGFSEKGSAKRLVKFPYDWRLDLFHTASDLAKTVKAAVADGATHVSLVGHSMGGLICRLVLEDPHWRGQTWFAAIKDFVAIATPHVGAPLALARVLGADSAMGISGADFRWLAEQTAYPSAYQLLPAPGEDACWDQSTLTLDPIDPYSVAGTERLGLVPELLARTRALHEILGAGNRPPGVRTFYFASTGYRTVTRVNVWPMGAGVDPDRTVVTRTPNAGDGTVPMFSALSRAPQRHVAVNEHATAFKGPAFRAVFVRLFGKDEGPALEALPVGDGQPRLAVAVEAPLLPSGRDVEVLLYADGSPGDGAPRLSRVTGRLRLTRIQDGEHAVNEQIRLLPVDYAGPPIERIRVYLEPIANPGHYRLEFVTDGPTASTHFAVCAV